MSLMAFIIIENYYNNTCFYDDYCSMAHVERFTEISMEILLKFLKFPTGISYMGKNSSSISP